MSPKIPPKIAVINSFAGYGRCSMTEALPIISTRKVQACPVPTSIFSNHTGFPSHYCQDFTGQMPDYLAQWDALGVVFDGIYCGFLGKKEQIPIVSGFLKSQKEKGCRMILVDPVMGDNGKAYRTITPEHCDALRQLVSLADIITPNITEACLLTDTPYREDGWSLEELTLLCEKLHASGPEKIAITGIRQGWETFPSAGNPPVKKESLPDGFLNFISEKNTEDGSFHTSCDFCPAAGPSRHGTGDIFASILAADAVLGIGFSESVHKAAAFIADCIRGSEELGIPEEEGVCFENYLQKLL